jgi:hypothetical protein
MKASEDEREIIGERPSHWLANKAASLSALRKTGTLRFVCA